MDNVNLKINGIDIQVPEGTTILEACRQVGIDIPSLCYMKELNLLGSCRICVVEVKGARSLVASCVYPVSEGMEVFTHTKKVKESRRMSLELILSNHRMDCITCSRSGHCELQQLSKDLGIDDIRFTKDNKESQIEDLKQYIIRDNSKCVLCRRCVSACAKQQGIAVIGPNERGYNTHIGCAFDRELSETGCVSCGQCINVCPTGALTERPNYREVEEAIADPNKFVVIGTAPSVRVALGECFGMPIGTNVEGEMVTALKILGFDKVFDVDTAADLTIMEEGTEFLDRLNNGGVLPLITSCSPGWVKYCERYYPEFIPNLSSCKSPQQMFGAIIKTYYAKKMNIDPKDIVVVSVMPCVAKKHEAKRVDMKAAGVPDIDIAITTRELGKLINEAGIRLQKLPKSSFDPAFGESTGAGLIFGATGGVMEAALRTVSEIVTGGETPVEFKEVRGTSDIKEAEYNLNGKIVKVAACSGLSNAKKLLDSIKSGEKTYDFIEIMACPGGCVNGGGQPIQSATVRVQVDIKEERAKALYQGDEAMSLRKSHKNPIIAKLYEEYLGEPGGHKAHEILHTTYQETPKHTL